MPSNPDNLPAVATPEAIAGLGCDALRHVWNTGDPPEGTSWPSDPISGEAAVRPVLEAVLAALSDEERGRLDFTAQRKLNRLVLRGAGAANTIAVTRRAMRKGDCFQTVPETVIDAVTPDFTLDGVLGLVGTLVLAAAGVGLVIVGTRQLVKE